MNRIGLVASIVMVAALMLAGTPALAEAKYPVFGMAPHHGAATLSGTVERISPTKFTLRAARGVVTVRFTSANPPVLDEGDNITVTFVPGHDGRDIDAAAVLLNQRANT